MRGKVTASLGLWFGVAALLCTSAIAQNYPTRPIRLMVGYAAGGPTDVAARMVAAQMEKRLQQPLVVENRPGANSILATAMVVKAEPDGYTLSFGNALSMHRILNKNSAIDASKELQPISNMVQGATAVVVRADLPIRTAQDLLAYARANPGKLNYGATGATNEMNSEVLRIKHGIQFTSVPFKGEAPQNTALLAGDIDFTTSSVLGIMQQIRAGKVRALFVTTSSKRLASLPDVPTAAEAGVPSFVFEFNWGLWAPLNTPAAIVKRLSDEAQAVARLPEFADGLRKLGLEPVGSTPEEQLKTFNAEVAFWSEAARLAKFEPQ